MSEANYRERARIARAEKSCPSTVGRCAANVCAAKEVMYERERGLTRPASWAVTEVIRSLPGEYSHPTTGMESALAAETVGVGRVSADSDLFDDLGADSLVMARFCARAGRRSDLPAVSMRQGGARPAFLPHEGRGDASARPVAGSPAWEFRGRQGFAGAATIANARARG
jgi:hypothetical protein